MFYRKAEKNLQGAEKFFPLQKRKPELSETEEKGSLCHEKIKNQRKDFSISSAGSLLKDMMQYAWKI